MNLSNGIEEPLQISNLAIDTEFDADLLSCPG